VRRQLWRSEGSTNTSSSWRLPQVRRRLVCLGASQWPAQGKSGRSHRRRRGVDLEPSCAPFSECDRILDYWHAVEHIWDLAHAAYGLDSLEARVFVRRARVSCGGRLAGLLPGSGKLDRRSIGPIEGWRTRLRATSRTTRAGWTTPATSALAFRSAAVRRERMQTDRNAASKGSRDALERRQRASNREVRCLLKSDRWDAFRAFWRTATSRQFSRHNPDTLPSRLEPVLPK